MAASSPTPADSGSEPQKSKRRFRTAVTAFWAVAALVLTLCLVGGGDESSDTGGPPHAPPAVSAAAPSTSAGPHRSGSSEARPHLPRSRPLRLLIPKIAVDAPFTALAIDRSGQLAPPPPDETNLVGWYAKGHSPGETGTAIIAGHVDTATSLAVFARLSELRKGDRFHVTRADGRRATFVVDGAESFEKDEFPDERVYGDTRDAQVRLITCSGTYDRKARDYTENLVVFAHLV
ncbi:class F sortase [Streptomyces sp. NPDC008137]|uniref:class F sortase n=1 Tax=Streptomyces sp. NPDC008137 TaxID=3364813 RepID=UPI0036E2D02B